VIENQRQIAVLYRERFTADGELFLSTRRQHLRHIFLHPSATKLLYSAATTRKLRIIYTFTVKGSIYRVLCTYTYTYNNIVPCNRRGCVVEAVVVMVSVKGCLDIILAELVVKPRVVHLPVPRSEGIMT